MGVSMAYSAVALTALALAAAASGPKWVPLNSVTAGSADEKPAKPQAVPQPASTQNPAPTSQPKPVAATPPAPAQSVEAVAVAATGQQRPLQLTCLGAGTATKFAFVGGSSYGTFSGFAGRTMINGTVSGSSSAVIPRDRQFADQVDIRLFAGDDRIRLPRTMLPPIHGGEAGWFKLKNVVADARSIRASAAINFMSNPKVYIDRITGTISISGRAGDYSGQCQAIEADAPAKF
jgi:hypothetical protein